MIKNLKDEIKKDFLGKTKSRAIELKFLKNISKSKLFISKKTGLVFHNDIRSSNEIVTYWSKKMYKNKMDPKKGLYTGNHPGMNSRHYYAIDFLSKKINLKNKSICDFACGEGGLLLKFKQILKSKKLFGVEHSNQNTKKIYKRFKKNKLSPPILYNDSIEKFNFRNLKLKKPFDVGTITWTLCACSEPLEVVKSMKSNLKKNGYLLVCESSRILVPFKKPIFNCFNPKLNCSGWTHPWYFTFNSLTNIFKYFGFEVVTHNRFFDEDNLVILFKNSHKNKYDFKIDNYKNVISFLKRWKKESNYYLKYKS